MVGYVLLHVRLQKYASVGLNYIATYVRQADSSKQKAYNKIHCAGVGSYCVCGLPTHAGAVHF